VHCNRAEQIVAGFRKPRTSSTSCAATKEQTGDNLGGRSLRTRGKAEKATADLGQAGEKIKDPVNR
jgi:hypothetical protein